MLPHLQYPDVEKFDSIHFITYYLKTFFSKKCFIFHTFIVVQVQLSPFSPHPIHLYLPEKFLYARCKVRL